MTPPPRPCGRGAARPDPTPPPDEPRGPGTFWLLARTVKSWRFTPSTSPILHSAARRSAPAPNWRSEQAGGPATQFAPRPSDATLTVTKAARLLGVHPNTIRAWSDQGRLRFYRINQRGDRRYRLGDLQRFLAAAERPAPASGRGRPVAGLSRPIPSIGAQLVELRTRPSERPAPADGSPDGADPVGPDRSLRLVVPGAPAAEPSPFVLSASSPLDAERRLVEMDLLGRLADLIASGRSLVEVAGAAVDLLHGRAGHDLAAVLERRDGRLTPIASRGEGADRLRGAADSAGLPGRALTAPGPVGESGTPGSDWLLLGHRLPTRIAVAIPGGSGSPWGVLVTADETPPAGLGELETFLVAVARQLGVAVHTDRLRAETSTQLHRAEALRRIATDIGSKLDLGQILAGVMDHARALFNGDRAAIFLRRADGRMTAEVARGLSEAYLDVVRDFRVSSLPTEAAASRRPLFATGYRDDPRAADIRSAVVQEGFDTICAAPLFDDADVVGLLIVYHDRPHPWAGEELATLAEFAAQAATAIKNAQNYGRMATWAAHLQSIQQLGTRLARLTTESEIGAAIANELDQLIEYHNVRVYRLRPDGWLVPVAMRGLVGEFRDETPDQLRTRLGQGITGWVAEHRLPQNVPDAANDPRAMTIPGTADDLDESMLLAPLLFEERVLGVIVLSKLGLRQFSDDDLRLLVIYAAIAAQAIANADSTEQLRQQSIRLERRLAGQRALIEVSGSILGTLDLPRVLDEVADRFAAIVRWDNICIEWVDPATGMLTPLMARGVHADEYMKPWAPGEEGLATWVLAHGKPQLVPDELQDPRVGQFASTGDVEGSLICVPLHGRDGVRGVVTVERLGTEGRFDEDDFELVQLFAAQASIAIRNAEAYRAIEIEAQTDDLTGLLNQGTFAEWLAQSVETQERFGLLMLDLDEFKTVNDRLGHQAGDDLLRSVAAAVREACRDSDHVFRYGGDEFTVICQATDAAGTVALAGRVRSRLNAIALDWGQRRGADLLSASIGVATYPEFGPTAAGVLLAADRACFVAKRRGRGQIATAEEGLALAGELTLQAPTPFDPRATAEDGAAAADGSAAAGAASRASGEPTA
ncbi:MAG: GAF domain-containing protein [Chloroflexota bacterium]